MKAFYRTKKESKRVSPAETFSSLEYNFKSVTTDKSKLMHVNPVP
jgi:hypothetical protein